MGLAGVQPLGLRLVDHPVLPVEGDVVEQAVGGLGANGKDFALLDGAGDLGAVSGAQHGRHAGGIAVEPAGGDGVIHRAHADLEQALRDRAVVRAVGHEAARAAAAHELHEAPALECAPREGVVCGEQGEHGRACVDRKPAACQVPGLAARFDDQEVVPELAHNIYLFARRNLGRCAVGSAGAAQQAGAGEHRGGHFDGLRQAVLLDHFGSVQPAGRRSDGGDLLNGNVRVVEVEDVGIAPPFVCHLLRAALAHAHAVAVAGVDQLVAGRGLARVEHAQAGVGEQAGRTHFIERAVDGDRYRAGGAAQAGKRGVVGLLDLRLLRKRDQAVFVDVPHVIRDPFQGHELWGRNGGDAAARGRDQQGDAHPGVAPAGRVVLGFIGFHRGRAHDAEGVGKAGIPHGDQNRRGFLLEEGLHFCRKGRGIGHRFGDGLHVLNRAGVGEVVGVVLHLIIGKRGTPGVFGGFGLPAVGGAVVGVYHLACAVGNDLPLRGVDRRNDVGLAGIVAVVHLVGGGIHHVVRGGGRDLAGRVASGAYGLDLQRLEREGIAHFVTHHAQKVIFQPHGVGHHQALRAGRSGGLHLVFHISQIIAVAVAGVVLADHARTADEVGLGAGVEHRAARGVAHHEVDAVAGERDVDRACQRRAGLAERVDTVDAGVDVVGAGREPHPDG